MLEIEREWRLERKKTYDEDDIEMLHDAIMEDVNELFGLAYVTAILDLRSLHHDIIERINIRFGLK